MTTKTSKLTPSTDKEILFPSNFSIEPQDEFHWANLSYNTILSQCLRQAGPHFPAGEWGISASLNSVDLDGCAHPLPDRKSTFQTFGKEVCLTDHVMCPVPSTVHREAICCECQAKFRGCLPVPRAEAVLPYWVPLSLRPQKQIQKMVQFYIPKTTKACPCLCHHFGGHLPVPRDQAMMPYWVPQALRSHKKVVKRQQNFKGIQETALDSCSWYNRWRICCDRHVLLKWQQLQALHQDERMAPERGESPPASLLPLLPLSLSLLTILQAILRVVMAIRQFF